jgi:hypothetical protein
VAAARELVLRNRASRRKRRDRTQIGCSRESTISKVSSWSHTYNYCVPHAGIHIDPALKSTRLFDMSSAPTNSGPARQALMPPPAQRNLYFFPLLTPIDNPPLSKLLVLFSHKFRSRLLLLREAAFHHYSFIIVHIPQFIHVQANPNAVPLTKY